MFNGAQYMTTPGNILTGGSARTIYLVFKSTGAKAGCLFSFRQGTRDYEILLGNQGNAGHTLVYADSVDHVAEVVPQADFTGARIVEVFTQVGSPPIINVNGIPYETEGYLALSQNVTTENGTAGCVLANNFAFSDGLVGSLEEVFVSDHILAGAELTQTRNYFRDRYAIELTYTPTDATATAAIEITGQPYVDPVNDIWDAASVTRWNRSRIHRLTNVTASQLSFVAVCLTGSSNQTLAVVSNGSLVASPVITADSIQRTYTVNLPVGTKTVEIWETFQGRATNLNENIDGAVWATYVTGIHVPDGASLVRNTANVGIIVGIDSLCDGVANEPMHWNGWCGQLRRVAQTAGQLLGYYNYGSGTLCGDGKTAAQMASDLDRLYTNMGTTTPKLVLLVRPNDWAYYNLNFFGVTSATYGTTLGAFLDDLKALRPSLVVDLIATIPQSTAQPPGADTLAQFITAINGVGSGRAWVTLHDGTAASPTGPGLSLMTDYQPDNVHPNQAGEDKLFAWIRAFTNIGL